MIAGIRRRRFGRAEAVGALRCRKHKRPVVPQFAFAAANQLQKKETAVSIEPAHRLAARTVNFVVTAVGTILPSNLRHGYRDLWSRTEVDRMFQLQSLETGFCLSSCRRNN